MVNYLININIGLFFSILLGADIYDSFPPKNLLPTYSNAHDLNLINNLNDEDFILDIEPIISNFNDLSYSREEFDFDNASHLLMRTTIGPTIEEINLALSIGLDATIDMLLDTQYQPNPPGDWIYHPVSPNYGNLTSTQKDSIKDEWDNRFWLMSNWWLDLMKYSEPNIRETMVLFWHNHFATSAEVIKFTPAMYKQNELFRKYAIGNFKDLVFSINYDPAMIEWLDNNENYYINDDNNTINENYSREILELFTMGEGNYSQEDIVEAARALTGISTDGMQSFFSPVRHDHGSKTFLGVTGNHTPEDIIDIIFDQQATSYFICKKLYQWFVYELPDEEIIDEMVEIFIDHNFNIEPVLRSLLASDHFFDENFRGSKYKSPVWFTAGTFRQLYLDYYLEEEFIIWYQWALGEALFYPPDVSGWDGYRSWINTYTLPYRKLFTNQIIDGDEAVIPEWDSVIEFSVRFNESNPELLLNKMINYLFSIKPSDTTISVLLEELLDGSDVNEWSLYDPGADQRLKDVIKHMMRLEEFQLR